MAENPIIMCDNQTCVNYHTNIAIYIIYSRLQSNLQTICSLPLFILTENLIFNSIVNHNSGTRLDTNMSVVL